MILKTLRRLGSGGFGIVDLVEDEDGSVYARKTYAPNQNFPPGIIDNVRRRFVREARTQSGIRHPNIVPVVLAELDASPPYYLMPPAICSLQDDLDRDRTLGGDWLSALADVVAALDELHQMGIFHRDLKPQNVLRFSATEGNARDLYAVSDFGLIAMNESRVSALTVTGMAKNTDYYTAPEITSDLRRASPQSDIYSLGCILHEFVGVEPRVPCHEIGENGEYGAILRNCTRRDPQRRFRSVRSVLDAIVTTNTALPDSITFGRADFGEQLASGEPLDQASWQALIEFVEDNESSTDAVAVLGRLNLDQVSDLCHRLPDLANRLGQSYSRWVHGSSFVFERCDSLSNMLEVFISSCSFDTKSEALLAMLELGTSHNRWYVERRFCNLCGPGMDEALARRVSVELRATGPNICHSIAHLERSIGFERARLHPILVQTLQDICS